MITQYMNAHGNIISRGDALDWCFNTGSKRTPREYPYSYDAHFLWRDFDKDDMAGIDSVYSDRMQMWTPEKYEEARKASGAGWIENLSRDAAIKFVETYYDGRYECVGFGRCCNQATGYGIGLFFMRKKNRPA